MYRSKKVLLLAHCVLNQNAVVHPLARAQGAFKPVMRMLAESDLGLIQLPCPEALYLGMGRKPMTREEYDQPQYRALCNKLADEQISFFRVLEEDGTRIVGILGIGDSPTCCLGSPRGLFMEELLEALHVPKTSRFDILSDVEQDSVEQWAEVQGQLEYWLASLDLGNEVINR